MQHNQGKQNENHSIDERSSERFATLMMILWFQQQFWRSTKVNQNAYIRRTAIGETHIIKLVKCLPSWC